MTNPRVTPAFAHVLCAVDFESDARRVLRHAAGIAYASGARLTLTHAIGDAGSRDAAAAQLREQYLTAIPYHAHYAGAAATHPTSGQPAPAILALAARLGADLIVIGARGRGPLASWLLGSVSRDLLALTSTTVAIVPNEGAHEILTLGPDRVHLHFGAVVAAVDLEEDNGHQLAVANNMATLAQQPLLLLTVLDNDTGSGQAATAALRERVRSQTIKPHAFVVRRGDVAEEIGRCAAAEGAGVVVMGLRERRNGERPGAIARAVLAVKHPVLFAVPRWDARMSAAVAENP